MLMNDIPAEQLRRKVDAVYRTESRRVLATLIRLLGDFDLAEDALHDAFAAALTQWGRDGVPADPRAWLVSVGRFKAIDGLRQRARGRSEKWKEEDSEDDQLRLIFTCRHPALTPDARVALLDALLALVSRRNTPLRNSRITFKPCAVSLRLFSPAKRGLLAKGRWVMWVNINCRNVLTLLPMGRESGHRSPLARPRRTARGRLIGRCVRPQPAAPRRSRRCGSGRTAGSHHRLRRGE